jgi:Na+/melibiose symporter-like transporter
MDTAPQHPPAANSRCARNEASLWHAGTLTYNRTGLTGLFSWLLAGDLVFVLVDQIEPRAMPVILKAYGASDSQSAFIVGTIPSLLMLLVNPAVSYASDRTRSRYGRRIPYLALATPLVSLFLALTPYAPDIAHACEANPGVARLVGASHVSPVILAFGVLVFCYHLFKSIVPAVYFALLRDVVPLGLLGRFMSLFRVVGSLATFLLTYWLVAAIETHAKPVFLGVAALNLVAFAAICLAVKEGDYPPVVDKVALHPGRSRLLHAVRNYCAECFSEPVYLWMYGARLLVYAVQMLIGYLIFFPQHELGLGLEASARSMAWPSLAWVFAAYPVGALIDRWGAVRAFSVALWLNAIAYTLTFFLARDELTYVACAFVTGILFWMAMLTQMVFLQALVHPQRVGQISSANALVQSLVIGFLITPLFGWFLDSLRDYHQTFSLPGLGTLEVGPYRCVNLVIASLFVVSAGCTHAARRHWLKLGGRDAYRAPL